MVGSAARGHDRPMASHPRRATWTLYALTIASGLPLAAIIAAATPMPEGACSGIGFGCSLYGWDAAGLALLILGVPYALGLTLVLGLLSLLPERHAPIATGVAAVGLAVPWVLTLLGAATS